jgi:hypothetical protein
MRDAKVSKPFPIDANSNFWTRETPVPKNQKTSLFGAARRLSGVAV